MVKKRALRERERERWKNQQRKEVTKRRKKQEREMHVQRLQYYNCGEKKERTRMVKQIHLNFLFKLKRKHFSGSRKKIFGPTNFFS